MDDGSIFGTDGIRGRVNKYPILPEVMLRLGKVLGVLYGKFVLGKDNRASSDMVESALISGALSVGAEVISVGCITTPVISFLARDMSVIGVVVSASHNDCYDNGVKFFNCTGEKFSLEMEREIQSLLDSSGNLELVEPTEVRRLVKDSGYIDGYFGFIVEQATQLGYPIKRKFKVVFDCANGSLSKIVMRLCERLSIDHVIIGTENDGFSVNHGCGVMHPNNIRKGVLNNGADLGVSFDGDGDRVIICDEQGVVVDGDQVIAFLAKKMLEVGELRNRSVVTTVMSNTGLCKFLDLMGVSLYRTDVGDRFVSRKMKELGSNLGGEKSGHVILSDFNQCSDGLVVAIKIIAMCANSNQPVSESFRLFEPIPQFIGNMKFFDKNVLDSASVCMILKDIRSHMAIDDRIILRKSGTEEGVVRIMVESHALDEFIGLLHGLEGKFAGV